MSYDINDIFIAVLMIIAILALFVWQYYDEKCTRFQEKVEADLEKMRFKQQHPIMHSFIYGDENEKV